MIQSKIDLYKDAWATVKTEALTVEKFHEDVKEGRWQDQIITLRAKKQAGKDITKDKEKLQMVTGSGTFKTRSNSNLLKHSGYLVIDIDKLGDKLQSVKEDLCQDPLFFSVFLSCSGGGLCGFVRISPKSHMESFFFMSEHMYYKYGLNIDTKCSDIVRPRFVTYDPDLYINKDSQLCPIKPAPKKKRRPKKYHFASEDFERIISDIKEAEYDLTEDYQDWIYCGFALVDKFGEEGRQYFHDISQYNPDYDYDQADAKYTHLLETKIGNITIDWFYHIIEQNGFQAYGKNTEDFIQQGLAEMRAYEAGLRDERPLGYDNLNEIDIPTLDIGIQIKNFLHKGYDVKKNDMTSAIEIDGEVMDDEILNTIYLLTRSVIDKVNSRELVYQVLDSRFTPRHHAFKDMMAEMDNNLPPDTVVEGHIEALVASLNSPTPNAGLFVKKWLVSIIGSMYGKHSPLMLILSGPQNCGKTSWFRQLLPERLRSQYYAESKLDEGKDDRILMSKKMLILDDEMSGKSKQEESRLKSTISQQQMDLRVPFGRTASSLNRIAVLCGTSNEEELISDPTGNRRLLPIAVKQVVHEIYNGIDKDLLFYEAYLEYLNGYNYELTNEEIQLLKQSTQNFKKSIAEEDLIVRYFGYPEENPNLEPEWLSLYEIADYIKARTRTQINTNTLGKYLKALDFVQKHKKYKKTTIRKYYLVVLDAPGKDTEDFKVEEI